MSILAIAHSGHGAAVVKTPARTVSRSNQVVIPDLRGWPLRKAAEFLADYRLRTHFAAKVSDAPANSVVEQIPSPHTPVRPGTDELVVISTGPRPTVQYSSGGGGDGGD